MLLAGDSMSANSPARTARKPLGLSMGERFRARSWGVGLWGSRATFGHGVPEGGRLPCWQCDFPGGRRWNK